MSAPEDVQAAARERLRRAAEDGQRLYEERMHGEPTIRDDNRIDGILTLDLVDALGAFDALASRLAAETVRADAAEDVVEFARAIYNEWHGGEPRYSEEDDLRDALARYDAAKEQGE